MQYLLKFKTKIVYFIELNWPRIILNWIFYWIELAQNNFELNILFNWILAFFSDWIIFLNWILIIFFWIENWIESFSREIQSSNCTSQGYLIRLDQITFVLFFAIFCQFFDQIWSENISYFFAILCQIFDQIWSDNISYFFAIFRQDFDQISGDDKIICFFASYWIWSSAII